MYRLLQGRKREETADITKLYQPLQTDMGECCWILIMRQVDCIKDIRQVRMGRRAEEEQGRYSCGMCDEQGHESGAGETMQNNNLHSLHHSPFITHPNSKDLANKGKQTYTHTHSSRLGLSIAKPVSFVLGSPVEMYTEWNCVAARLGLMSTLCFLWAASLCSCSVQLKVWACMSAEGRLVEMCWRERWTDSHLLTPAAKSPKYDGGSDDVIWGRIK